MIQTGRMANSSYTKLFFPCSEQNGASDVNPTDVILGAVTNLSGTNTGDGSKVSCTAQASSTTITAGTFPTISGTQSFIWFVVAADLDSDGFSGWRCTYGDISSGSKIQISKAAFGNYAAEIGFGGATVTLANVTVSDATNPHGYALACERGGNASFSVDGVTDSVTASVAAYDGISVNPPVNELMFSNCDLYAAALFVFDGDLPDDYEEALAWMAPRWAVDQLVIWPAWEDK